VSSYYFAKNRAGEPTARDARDAVLKDKIMVVWKGSKGREVYGARKVWLELNRQGVVVARCTVERLMRGLGIGGVQAGRKRPRTTVPGDPAQRPADLLERCFGAAVPNRRWVADITYVLTLAGWVYAAFVMDLFGRRILGWQSLITCVQISRSTPSKWRSGRAATRVLTAWSTIPIVVCSIPRSGIRRGSPKRRRSGRSAARVTLMIMLLRNP
jgi:transposase InsO family protein